MKNFTIKGIPDELLDRVRRNAAANRRSLNQEMVVALERSSPALGFDPEEMLAQVQAARAMLGHVTPLTEEFLEEAINEGRP